MVIAIGSVIPSVIPSVTPSVIPSVTPSVIDYSITFQGSAPLAPFPRGVWTKGIARGIL